VPKVGPGSDNLLSMPTIVALSLCLGRHRPPSIKMLGRLRSRRHLPKSVGRRRSGLARSRSGDRFTGALRLLDARTAKLDVVP
jgi:hypothetical protein